MQHFLQSVNYCRLVFFLGDELNEEFAEFVGRYVTDGDVDERGKDAVRMDAEDTLERRLAMDPERVDILESVERFAADQTLVGDHELEFARVTGDEKIADDTDQDENDRHERAIGKDGVGDDEREENGRNHEAARIWPDMDMFRSAPRQDGVADKHWFHRSFRFLHYTMTSIRDKKNRMAGLQAYRFLAVLWRRAS